MKASALFAVVFTAFVVTGCEEPQVVAEIAITDESGAARVPLPDLPIRLLPYDRDAIMDSLAAAFSQPEPPIPPELLAQQQQVQLAQLAWRAAEGKLTAVRDSIRDVNDRLGGLRSRGSSPATELAAMQTRLQSLEATEQVVNQEVQTSFARFDLLQQQTLAATDSIRVLRDSWAQEAFASFDEVIALKLEESGLEEVADTTDAQGTARFRVPNGTWWVYGRYTLPYEELYWNVPLEAAGDSTHVELTRENADIRPIL